MIPNCRIWDIKNKYYLDDMSGYDLYFQDGKIYEQYEYSYCYTLVTKMVDVTDQYIVEIGSGILDLNQKEIFEGDIVNQGYTRKYSTGETYDCYYDLPVSFNINHGAWLMGEYKRVTPKNVKKDSIKVVGTIHDER